MKILAKNRIIAPQAAIDTVCDHCGGIFDLNDGVVNASGKILCAECMTVDAVAGGDRHNHDQLTPRMNPVHGVHALPRHSLNP